MGVKWCAYIAKAETSFFSLFCELKFKSSRSFSYAGVICEGDGGALQVVPLGVQLERQDRIKGPGSGQPAGAAHQSQHPQFYWPHYSLTGSSRWPVTQPSFWKFIWKATSAALTESSSVSNRVNFKSIRWISLVSRSCLATTFSGSGWRPHWAAARTGSSSSSSGNCILPCTAATCRLICGHPDRDIIVNSATRPG